MNRPEQFDPSMADAKEFQASQPKDRSKAFLCAPQPPRPKPPMPCTPPMPCSRPCK